jgi:hypothetical protein
MTWPSYTTLSPQEQYLIYNANAFNSGIFVSGESNYGLKFNQGPLLSNPSGIDDSNIYSGRLIGGNSGLLDINAPWYTSNTHADITPATGTINVINDDGTLNGTYAATGLSIFRPQWDPSIKRSVYNRSSLIDPDETPTALSRRSLSTSNQTSYPDFLFQEYIHYESNPTGGLGLLDLSPNEIKTQVTISRNIRTATWSPYS